MRLQAPGRQRHSELPGGTRLPLGIAPPPPSRAASAACDRAGPSVHVWDQNKTCTRSFRRCCSRRGNFSPDRAEKVTQSEKRGAAVGVAAVGVAAVTGSGVRSMSGLRESVKCRQARMPSCPHPVGKHWNPGPSGEQGRNGESGKEPGLVIGWRAARCHA